MRLSDGLWHELCDLEHLYPDEMATWLIVLGVSKLRSTIADDASAAAADLRLAGP
jgi:hypothetical protein